MFKLYSRKDYKNKVNSNNLNEGFIDDAKAKLGKLFDKVSSLFKDFFGHKEVVVTEEYGTNVGTYSVDGKEFVKIFDFGKTNKSDDSQVNESVVNEEIVPLYSPNEEIIDISYDSLYDELDYFLENKDKSLFLWGAPGIGKTQSVIKFAKDKGIKLVIINTSVKDPTDFIGLPSIERDEEGKGSTTFNLPKFFPRVEKGSNKASEAGMLFFDELNTATQPVLVSCQQLILDRKLDNYEVPSNWMIAAAGNRSIDNPAAVKTMSAPLSNRFYHVNLVVDVDSWAKWFAGVAKSSDGTLVVLPIILNFLKLKPDWLHLLDTDKLAEGSPWPSPRTWTMASEKLKWALKKNPNLDKKGVIATIAGWVGRSAASEFAQYYMDNSSIDSITKIFTPEWAEAPKLNQDSIDDVDKFNTTVDIAAGIIKKQPKSKMTLEQLFYFVNYMVSLNNEELASALGKGIISEFATDIFLRYKNMYMEYEKAKDAGVAEKDAIAKSQELQKSNPKNKNTDKEIEQLPMYIETLNLIENSYPNLLS